MDRYLENYRSFGFNQVQGWAMVELIEVFNMLAGMDINKSGGVLEIGVHHGRFFILLNALTGASDQSFAVDVFEDQRLNIDNSGSGSRNKFEENLRLYDRHNGSNTKIIAGDSTDSGLLLPDIIQCGSLRYISVDGGHTVEHTVNDLVLANKLIRNDGLVILDDFLNRHWLGVTEGAFKYLQSYPTLVPVALGFNKLFLCKLSYYDYYFSAFDKFFMKTKVVVFGGRPTVVM